LKIEPCLATSWETLDPLHWRFHLRAGVKFHEGQDFTADDVVFSAHRVLGAGSDLKGVIPADADVIKVDDHTVDFVLKMPNPLLINQWATCGNFFEEQVGGAWRERGDRDERHDSALRRPER
jgi:peptide/nickel transport system substrate-binding protein